MREKIFPSENEDRMLRAVDVCQWLNIAESTLYKWIKAGRFPKPLSLGDESDQNSASRFFKSEVEEWLYARPRGKFHGTENASARSPRVRKNVSNDQGDRAGVVEGDEA